MDLTELMTGMETMSLSRDSSALVRSCHWQSLQCVVVDLQETLVAYVRFV
jgi:hypothetical protein